MDNIFRPSHAFPPAEDTESVFHDLIGSQITKQLEALTAEVWAKHQWTGTPEQLEAFRKSVREKMALKQPAGRVIYTFDIIPTRTSDEK